jgi:iron complex transport system ATP-binding protein
MRLEKVNAGYGKKIIVRGVCLEIVKGEIISLIGPNGGGKSTLLKIISGELQLLGGEVFLEKDSIATLPLKEIARRLSIVTTQRIKPEHMTCFDIVLSGRLPFTDGFGSFKDEDRKRAIDAMKLLNIEQLSDTDYQALSDGQKQRALIARAIAQDPTYLVMDEPTSYLDIRYRMELMDVIRKLSGEGVTIIMSLHELDMALEISNRVLLIKENGETELLEPKEVLDRGILKELYGMTDEMYEKVHGQLSSNVDRKALTPKHSTYFVNRKCEYFPCHELEEDVFSCLFCYCPLYHIDECGGTFTYADNGIKKCKDCTFPHDRRNYGAVIKKLKGQMYGDS